MPLPLAPSPARLDAPASFEPATLREAGPRWLRRAAFLVPVLGSTALGTALAAQASAGAGGALRPALLALLAVNLLYMALTGWPALLGALVRLGRRPGLAAPAANFLAAPAPTGRSRTALVMPVHNEDPRLVFAALEAMGHAVAEAGLRGVDLFVLSDTGDAAIAAAEEAEFARLQARLADGPALHYRRRKTNAGRKVGNLLEFCTGRGTAYDYMLVLDADSLMGAGAIAALIGLMDANPNAGIIQTVPYAVGRETPFARFQQFSARLYTPLLIEGLHFWQGGEANYWGHNAMLRIAPFVAHCGLPVLPGREPFGGEILCHDVVEAGLMRAAGWDVWVLPATMESFESVPANLVDFASRERRWCQGNLQHLGVLPDRRLRALGRFHLAYGILHYLAAPAAALFLALATLDSLLGGRFARALLEGGAASSALVGLAAALLYGCKAAGLLAALASPARARRFGGRARLAASAVLEQLGALVVSAVLILLYCRFTLDLLLGASVRWEAQPRDDRGLLWAEAWARLRLPTLVGAAWLALLLRADPVLLAWCAPLLFGLLASVPLAVLSSRRGLGRVVRRLGLFLTPEEVAPAAVLRAYQRLLPPAPTVPARVAAPGLHLAAHTADGA